MLRFVIARVGHRGQIRYHKFEKPIEKKACKPVEQEENHEKGPRRSWGMKSKWEMSNYDEKCIANR
jgi:hypothetical protein